MKLLIIDKQFKEKDSDKIYYLFALTDVLDYGLVHKDTIKIEVSKDFYEKIEVEKMYDLDIILPKPQFSLKLREK